MTARKKPKQATLKSKQGILLAACGCLLVATIFASRYFGSWHLSNPNSSPQLESNDSEFVHTQVGLLVLHGPGDACRAYKYDNLTSETFPASGPCEITAQIDRRITGEPNDGSRQFEALSKYFRQH